MQSVLLWLFSLTTQHTVCEEIETQDVSTSLDGWLTMKRRLFIHDFLNITHFKAAFYTLFLQQSSKNIQSFDGLVCITWWRATITFFFFFYHQVTQIWTLSANKPNQILHMWSWMWFISALWLCGRCQKRSDRTSCGFYFSLLCTRRMSSSFSVGARCKHGGEQQQRHHHHSNNPACLLQLFLCRTQYVMQWELADINHIDRST